MIPYKVINENRLTHSSGPWKNHKYKSRTGSPGNYVYSYSDDLKEQLEEAKEEADAANEQINDTLDEYERDGLDLEGNVYLGPDGSGAKVNYTYDPFKKENKNSIFNVTGDSTVILNSDLSSLKKLNASPALNFINGAMSVNMDVEYENGKIPSIGNVKVNFDGGKAVSAIMDSKASKKANEFLGFYDFVDDLKNGR